MISILRAANHGPISFAGSGVTASRLLRHCSQVHCEAQHQAARVFIKMFNYKLNAQPNALKFGQHVCECTRINPRNTDYD